MLCAGYMVGEGEGRGRPGQESVDDDEGKSEKSIIQNWSYNINSSISSILGKTSPYILSRIDRRTMKYIMLPLMEGYTLMYSPIVVP